MERMNYPNINSRNFTLRRKERKEGKEEILMKNRYLPMRSCN